MAGFRTSTSTPAGRWKPFQTFPRALETVQEVREGGGGGTSVSVKAHARMSDVVCRCVFMGM